jgi:hypothetical protein
LLESEQIERIASALQGLDFGMLILAAPVPSKMVSDEEFIVLDELHKAKENEDAEKKRRLFMRCISVWRELKLMHSNISFTSPCLTIGGYTGTCWMLVLVCG